MRQSLSAPPEGFVWLACSPVENRTPLIPDEESDLERCAGSPTLLIPPASATDGITSLRITCCSRLIQGLHALRGIGPQQPVISSLSCQPIAGRSRSRTLCHVFVVGVDALPLPRRLFPFLRIKPYNNITITS